MHSVFTTLIPQRHSLVISTDEEGALRPRRSGAIHYQIVISTEDEGAKATEDEWRDDGSTNADSGSSPQALSPKPHFPAPVFCQVLPPRVELLNQGDLFFPPSFNLLLTCDGHLHILVALVMNQTMALVLLGETFDGVVLVLINAAIEEACDAHVKRSGSAGKNVNPEFVVIAVAREGEEDNTPAAWRERLIAAWQGTLCRDLSTPPQSQSSFLVGRDDKGMVVLCDGSGGFV